MSPSTDPGQLAVDNVRSLSPYVPGKPIEELQRELGLTDIIKLASNENPFGPSPQALAAMQRALADTWLYPDGSGHVLKHKLAAKLGVDVSADHARQWLQRSCWCCSPRPSCKPGLEAVYSQYAFAVYPIAVQATGATGVWCRALTRRFRHAAGPRPRRHGARHHAAHAHRVRRQP